MDFLEDLPLMYADLGVPATLAGAAVRGVFRNPRQAFPAGYAGMSAEGPSFELPTASVPDQVEGKTLVVNGGSWKVARHDHDGAGVSTLLLKG